MNRHLARALCGSVVLAAVVFGAARAEPDDDGAHGSTEIAVVDGLKQVRFEADVGADFGIVLGRARVHERPRRSQVFGEVVPIDALLARAADIELSRHAVNGARQATAVQRRLLKRIDEKRASGLSIDTAQRDREARLLGELQTLERAAELKLKHVLTRARIEWGERLGAALADREDPLLGTLSARRTRLVIAPLSDALTPEQFRVEIAPLGAAQRPVQAELIGPATENFGARGASYFFSAAAPGLRDRMRVTLWLEDPDHVTRGVLLSRDALVWYDGQQWIYVRIAPGIFERRPLRLEQTIGEEVFATGAVDSADEIVIKGASGLLGEEFRWSIPDEDDD